MGIEEVAVFTAALQLSQAVNAYLGKISPPPSNPWAAAAVIVGQQLAKNAATAFASALAASEAEFKIMQTAEKGVVADLHALPPIS